MNCIRCGRNFDASSGPCPGCQWNPNARQKPLAGYLVGEEVADRFAVREPIGMGRLGAVVKAVDLKTKKPVALKLIHPALIPDEETGNRFLAGMQAYQKIKHSGLTRIIDVGRDGKNYFIARELLVGVTFKQLLGDQQICGQPFPVEEAVELVQQIARVLTIAPRMAHGTFSPSKIWVLDKKIKIVDFGLAGSLPPDAVWHCMRRKDNRYLAPEYVDNRPPDAGGDVFALGIILGEMLSLAEYEGKVEIFRESEPDFPVEIEALLRCALSQDVDVRYADAMELVATLFDVTGFQRTKTMPPDNTNVVPSKFLNTLRSMSEAPPPDEKEEILEEEELLDDDDLLSVSDSDDGEPLIPDENEVITRQVVLDELISESAEEEDLDFLDDFQPPTLDDDDFELEPEAPPRPSSLAITPPPYRPSNVDELAGPSQQQSQHPRPPLPSAPPRVSGPPPPPIGAGKSTPSARASRKPEPPPPMKAGSAADAPPSKQAASDQPEVPTGSNLEGINPRFLRAAAKLEKARISEMESLDPGGVTQKAEEDWRKQLEESSAGSVISFLPPSTVEDPADVKGFPKNQQQADKPQLPMAPPLKSKPPPIPNRRK